MTYEAWRISYQSSEQAARAAYAECWRLQAKIEAMETQEPVMWANSSNINSSRINRERGGCGDQHTCSETQTAYHDTRLYALPVAQPAPGEPVVTPKMEQAFYEKVEVTTVGSIRGLANGIKAAMLAAAAPKPGAMTLSDEQIQELLRVGNPTDEECRLIRMGWDAAMRTKSAPDGWLRAIDEALVVAHIGVANAHDTYAQAKAKLDSLIGLHVDIATDPAVNGGWKLMPVEPTKEIYECFAAYDGSSYSNPFDFDDFSVDYAAALEAAQETKP